MTTIATVQQVSVDNPVENDLLLTSGQILLLADGDDTAIAQSIRNRLRFFKGEWFLDLREGVPYFEEVYIKNPKINTLRGIFRDVLAGTPGVDSVISLDLSIDVPTRVLSMSFAVGLTAGGVLNSNDFIPFLIEV